VANKDSKVLAPAEKKLPPNAGKGRKAGVPNKTTAALKDAILLAATSVGFDGKGQDGLTGYLKMVATTDTKAFSALLGKVLPMTLEGPNPDGSHSLNVAVNFVRANRPA
jgi:hypothetical protein